MRNFAILVFALFILLSPLHYYLGNNPNDERFAWRMFSAERVRKCRVTVYGDHQILDIKHKFHPAWHALMRRGWPTVWTAVAKRLCTQEHVKTIHIERTCNDNTVSEPWTFVCS